MRPVLAGLLLLLMCSCKVDPFCVNCPDESGDGSNGAGGGGIQPVPPPGDSGAREAGPAVCIEGDRERCNGTDDDCDFRVDEDFDLDSDPRNCGACGNNCALGNTDVTCVAGLCAFVGCLEGFADLSNASPDCEYRCPVFPSRTEQCNGLDDDCDGEVDEQAELPPPPEGLCRNTAGTPCAGVTAVCRARGGVTTWYCDYPDSVEFEALVPNGIVRDERLCDGLDGDCDGVPDDSFPTLGSECDNGALGACRDPGRIVCDPIDSARIRCDLSVSPDPVPGAPAAELCNGMDDNCDGEVDNSAPDDPARILDDLVRITHSGLDFYIYRHEASRADADALDAGSLSARSCSKAGAIPWTNVGLSAARTACNAAGHRLCSAAEWQAACEGTSTRTFPYGSGFEDYKPGTCNGADRDGLPDPDIDHLLNATGSLTECVSEDGVFDLSGNAKEWTEDPRGDTGPPASTPIHVTRGGSAESPRFGLTCQTDLSRAQADSVLPFLGFRCCRSTPP